MNIYVGNIPYAAAEEDLEELFGEYGLIAKVTIIRDRHDGRSKGFGFVEMENQEDGERAIEALDGQEMMGRPLKVNKARPREQHRQLQRQDPPAGQSQRARYSRNPSPSGYFNNPYTFVSTAPRNKIKAGEFAGDFNPLECNLDHASLKKDLWTGHIPITLKTITPLVLLKTEGEALPPEKPYDVLNYIPESSLRGMLRSVYEIVTNSRYGCFSNDNRLAYRMRPPEALKLVPAIIEDGDGGKLSARLYTGTSTPTSRGPGDGTGGRGPMYAAMLTCYPTDNSTILPWDTDYTPKTGNQVWAEVVLCEHDESPNRSWDWNSDCQPDRNYRFWKVVKVWPRIKNGQSTNKPELTGGKPWPRERPETDTNDRQSYYSPLRPEDRRIVKGVVLITNKNIEGKHDERVFFADGENAKNPIICDVTELEEAWRMRIQSYRKAHRKAEIFERKDSNGNLLKPWESDNPDKPVWSPHLYNGGAQSYPDGAIKLKPGDMVYARCEFNSRGITIRDLFPVMISRELYKKSPKDLLDASLRPAKELRELSPADRLFGWAPKGQGSEGGYKSRIRIVCDGAIGEDGKRQDVVLRDFGEKGLPLTILGEPKPAQGRFYVGDVAEDKRGIPQKQGIDKVEAGYNKGKVLRGRKQYWHHNKLEAEQAPDGYWDPLKNKNPVNGRYQEYRRLGDKRDPQNRSIKGWIEPGTVFQASLYVQNLESQELGALLWLLSLNDAISGEERKRYFRLGYGKPLGFGSVEMEIDKQYVDKGLPLGTREDWENYYAAFNKSPPAKLDVSQRNTCIRKFKKSMVQGYKPEAAADEDEQKIFESLSFISEFQQVLRGPKNDAFIHYPRQKYKPDPQGKNFLWFVDNEKQHRRLALPKVTSKKGLPYTR